MSTEKRNGARKKVAVTNPTPRLATREDFEAANEKIERATQAVRALSAFLDQFITGKATQN